MATEKELNLETVYTIVGCAKGRFKRDDGEMQEYAHIYALSPVSSFKSESYEAIGQKAEKLKCASPSVWDGIKLGTQVQVLFNGRQQVAMIMPV